jgi:signal transduction histidine kinase
MHISRYQTPRYRYILAYALFLFLCAGVLGWLYPTHWWAFAVMGGIGLVLAWIVALVGERRIRRRLHQLRETTDALGRGELSQRVECLPNDDFIKLSASLHRVMKQFQEKVEEENRLKQRCTRSEKLALIGELAAIVAHEINNPLDGLQNSTRIIRRNLDNEKQVRQLLTMMDDGLYRIQMIVNRLLTMSRDEPVHPEPTPVDQIVEDASMFTQPKLDRYGIELVCDLPSETLWAQADRMQMAQAFINLVLNSADAMSRGGRLVLRCQPDQDGQHVLFEVTDTGCGIADEHLPNIFEPFYTTKGSGVGSGLGLAVTRRIIEAHKGSIEVDTRPDQGTTFWIKLPAAYKKKTGPQSKGSSVTQSGQTGGTANDPGQNSPQTISESHPAD